MNSPAPPIQRHEIVGFDDLKSAVAGKVFHATTEAYYRSILESGFISPSTDDRHSPFGNTVNGFFREKGCISFFDYREFGTPAWEEHAFKCLPTMLLQFEPVMILLFLSPALHASLMPWTVWKDEEAWSQRVVPHVEAGFPGPLALSAIDLVMLVSRKPSTV